MESVVREGDRNFLGAVKTCFRCHFHVYPNTQQLQIGFLQLFLLIDPTESRLEQHEYEEHQSCKCECKVKADQCDKRTQTYDPYNCRCDCNPDAEVNSKCLPTQQVSHQPLPLVNAGYEALLDLVIFMISVHNLFAKASIRHSTRGIGRNHVCVFVCLCLCLCVCVCVCECV